jgi:non-haem Fe2+, alpha-ketoglutarate-dependent halogenase
MPKALTADQVEQFHRLGYAHPFRAMSAEEARAERRRLEAFEREVGHEAQRIMKIKAHLPFPSLVALARRKEILDAVEDVIGPDILLFGASLFSKNARDSRYVSWHQDSAYFGLEPHEEVTVWVAFTDSHRENGCLRVLAGSHIGPDHTHVETYAPDNLLARGQRIEGIDEGQAVDLVLQAGEFSIHHERTVHGSLANRSDDRRIGLAYFFIPAHVRSTIGRRSALLMRGENRWGYWDADPEPRFDQDPICMAKLHAAWDEYRDVGIRQAAAAGRI